MLIDGANPTVKNIIFTANLAVYGGGFYANSGNVTLTNVTFSGNHASSGGGGGLFSWNSGPTLTNVTFKGNSTTGSGGAIYGYGSVPILINVTMTGNNASLLGDGIFSIAGGGPDIRDSILWADGTQEVANSSTTATIHNSTVKGGCPASSTCVGILGSNPLLGTLKNNGGFTTTMALGAGSPAIDHGNNASCASTDQRGFARPQGPKCDMGAYEVRVATYPSVGSYDGWLLESAVNSGTGGSMNASSTTVRLGDDAANRQYRSLFSFNTAPLPDAATIVLARVRLDKQGLVGTNPFTTHGALTMDLAKPYFGSAVSLATNDFQAGYTVAGAGTVSSTPSGAWYTGTLNHSGYTAVNKTGTTQLRLRFNLHSNLDNGADYLAFYSGNASSAQRPQLLVYYNP
jgi:predicted outer membrane repeat protein